MESEEELVLVRAYMLTGRKSNSSNATPLRRHVRRQNAEHIDDLFGGIQQTRDPVVILNTREQASKYQLTN